MIFNSINFRRNRVFVICALATVMLLCTNWLVFQQLDHTLAGLLPVAADPAEAPASAGGAQQKKPAEAQRPVSVNVEAKVLHSINSDARNRRLVSALPSQRHDEPFDRRLLPLFWVHLLNKSIRDNKDGHFVPEDFKLPFNWDLLNDYAHKIQHAKYFDKVVRNKLSCKQFLEIAPDNQPLSFLENYCVTYDYNDPNFVNDYKVPFLVVRKVDQYLKDVEWRRMYGMLYSLTNSPIPRNVLFLGGVGENGGSLLVPLRKVTNGKNNLASIADISLQSHYSKMEELLVADYMLLEPGLTRSEALLRGISLSREWDEFNEIVLVKENAEELPSQYFPSKPMLLLAKTDDPFSLKELKLDEFQFYSADELLLLEKLLKNLPPGADTRQLQHLLDWTTRIADPKFQEPWYYGIPSVEGQPLDHYDWRFFTVFTIKEDPQLHTAILHRLSRVWFQLCVQYNVASWMNHGPVIGWYWSGVTLPYDYDLDLQLPIQHLHKLAKVLNNTLIYDFSNREYINDGVRIDSKAEMGIRSYLFDVDPMYLDRNSVKSSENDIDARLIDTETGIYIDLTAVSDFHSGNNYDLELQRKFLEKSTYMGYRLTVPTHYNLFMDDLGEYLDDRIKGCVMKDQYVSKINQFIEEKDNKDSRAEGSPTKWAEGYVHDKHYHTYKITELSPLIPTFYEGYLSYLPANWKKNLKIEYSGMGPLSRPVYNKYRFVPGLEMWISHEECPLWDKDSGMLTTGFTDEKVSLQCITTEPLLDALYQRSIVYSSLHHIHRDAITKGQSDVFKMDKLLFETKVKPTLLRFDSNLFIPEPFIETLYE